MGLGLKLEKSSIIDLLTVGVLAFDGYMLYTSLEYQNSQVMSLTQNPVVVAIQLTGLLVVVYGLEFVYDKFKGSKNPYS